MPAEEHGPLGVGHVGPRTLVEGPAGGAHCAVDVGCQRLGHPEVDLLGARVDHLDGRRGRRRHPFPADEETVRVPERHRGLSCGGHRSSLRWLRRKVVAVADG